MSGRMILEAVRSEGLAHISYILAHNGKASVIDPRRDCAVYIEIAHRHGAAITHIFETHRNEDYIIGSSELAHRTGAQIYHGGRLNFRYGNPVADGDIFMIGDMEISVIETPGHTYESISILLADTGSGREPLAVFTGDTLFIGDVGRTDFFPDRAEEVAGLLYDSIFNKLLPLGDHVIVYPGHGAGSVCGKGMAPRDFSTIGYERLNNPVLRLSNREEFIRHKTRELHYKPGYFSMMEEFNLEGSAPLLSEVPPPRPMGPSELADALEAGALVLDTRSPEAFAGAFIPGSLSIPLALIPAFAGYYLSYKGRIVLVVNDYPDVNTAVRYLARMGYDNVTGFLAGGLRAWEISGRLYDRIPTVHAGELVRRIKSGEQFTLLDVRGVDELKGGRLPGSLHAYVGELPKLIGTIPRDRTVTTFCESGYRAIIAASILKRNGFEVVEDALGSMAACMAIGCPVVK